MGRFDGIMIVSDLDGTYLGAQSRRVVRNDEAVRMFCAEGGLFTLATGRHHDHLMQDLPDVATLCNIPVIFANGAYLYDYASGQVLSEIFMDAVPARDLIRYASAHHPRVGFRITTPKGFLTDGRTDIIRRFIEKSNGGRDYAVEVGPMSSWTEKQWYKIVFRGAAEDISALRAGAQERFGGVLELTRSSETYLEAQRLGCTKGAMLRRLADEYAARLGCPITTYGVGNFENDIPLLQAADVAVCPDNAHKSVLSVADLVLCDNDAGTLGDLIERIGH